jgi:hypothetical protein
MQYILEVLPANSTILELGSGTGTHELAKFYNMYSVEDNKKWVGKYDSHYIHAPIRNYGSYRWYDIKILRKNLPNTYDLILIDGPTGKIGRGAFYENLFLFNTNSILIFDDVNRPAELKLIQNVAQELGRPYKIYPGHRISNSSFGVILPD